MMFRQREPRMILKSHDDGRKGETEVRRRGKDFTGRYYAMAAENNKYEKAANTVLVELQC